MEEISQRLEQRFELLTRLCVGLCDPDNPCPAISQAQEIAMILDAIDPVVSYPLN
ncbi:MAG TPA: hypothetical protein VMY18_13790 [Acidobacteriota bacterium]|nr:hypothetical protein [Acidobacteriota bacterium]